jgi:hypothetical protein
MELRGHGEDDMARNSQKKLTKKTVKKGAKAKVTRFASANRVAGTLRSKPKTPYAHLQRVRSRNGANLPAEVGGSEQIEPMDQSEDGAIHYPIPGRVSDGLGRTI